MIRVYVGRDASAIESQAVAFAGARFCASILLWPELSADPVRRPVHFGVVAGLVDAVRAAHGLASGGDYVVATMSEAAVLRLRRRVAEGTLLPSQLLFVDADTGDEIHVDASGEVDAWPEGLFSEDFEEVKAIRRAQRAREAEGSVPGRP